MTEDSVIIIKIKTLKDQWYPIYLHLHTAYTNFVSPEASQKS